MRAQVTAVDDAAFPGDVDGGRDLFVHVPTALYAALRDQALLEGRTIADLLRAGGRGYLALVVLNQATPQ